VTLSQAGRTPARPHGAARFEDAIYGVLERALRRRGWRGTVVAYTGYGGPGWVRVLARVLLTRPGSRRSAPIERVRGWRAFTTLPVARAPLVIEAGGKEFEVRADRGGYLDQVIEADLPPGWTSIRLRSGEAESVEAPVRIVGPDVTFGVVSDVDDTVMVTALPRPLLAGWNTFVLDEHARAAVPGMAVLYERLATRHPGAPVFYLSTGAWNVAPTLTRFLSRHLYPAGPLLLTDWGPTSDRWFRSGQDHKRATLVRLAAEFPNIRWLLIGDDGQHDEQLYREFAASHPDHVAGVAIRRLSPTESVLAGTLPAPARPSTTAGPAGRPWLSAPDGAGLWALLSQTGLAQSAPDQAP
jgi:phosphatidate phosphatase APP1